MTSPFLITGPALISFSGGRTSAYMLKMILDAHGGTLPDHVHVCFANTGKEREETLRFVHECATRWNVRVRWLEWRTRPIGPEGRKVPNEDRFEEVGANSASRNGEPFKALIRRKRYLPNAVSRFCTAELKIEVMKWFMQSLGYERWTNVVGLRADEMHRVFKQIARNEEGKECWRSVMPMATRAGQTTARDVWRFWLGDNADPKRLLYPLPQGFDLGLYPWEGNCDGCFLKGEDILAHQERERPGTLDDWIGMELLVSEIGAKADGARFITERSYAEIKNDVERQPLLIPIDWRSVEYDAECGTWCPGEAA
jgi:3'-phosphoadenosine 5'-phosphosulfate sulfotransferase (PAPS reductase)/FAD synthetase